MHPHPSTLAARGGLREVLLPRLQALTGARRVALLRLVDDDGPLALGRHGVDGLDCRGFSRAKKASFAADRITPFSPNAREAVLGGAYHGADGEAGSAPIKAATAQRKRQVSRGTVTVQTSGAFGIPVGRHGARHGRSRPAVRLRGSAGRLGFSAYRWVEVDPHFDFHTERTKHNRPRPLARSSSIHRLPQSRHP